MNIVDKIVIELGFDPTEFRKGTTETTKQVDTLTRKVNSASDSMGKSITDLANKFAVAFLGWRGLQEAIATNRLETQMRLTSENTGVAIEKVNAFSEVLRVKFGAGANDAAAALRKISEAQTAIRTTGLDEGWKTALSRFPIDKFHGLLGDLNKARDPLQVMLDIADSLHAISQGPGGRPDAFNLGVQLGLPESAVNEAIEKGRAGLEKDLAFQEKRFKLTPKMAAQSQKTAESFRQLEITGEHALMRLMDKLEPFVVQITTWLDKTANNPAALTAAADGLKLLANGIQFFVDVVKLAVRGWSEIMQTGFGKAMQEMFGAMAKEVHEFANNKITSTDVAKDTGGRIASFFSPPELHSKDPTERAAAEDYYAFPKFSNFAQGLSDLVMRSQFGAAANAAAGGANVTIGTVVVHSQATSIKGAGAEVAPAVVDSLKKHNSSIVKQANSAYGSGS